MGCNWSAIQARVEDFVEDQQQQQQQAAQATTGAVGSSKLSAVRDSLPDGAEQHTVRNVYDGDTLTLVDERRVRLLGIDTPEIKEKQAFAQEAKAYTKGLCHKKEVYLTFEPFGDKEDHYGRLLAFVWVSMNDGGNGGNRYLCVNEGIVAEGLACVYLPKKDAKLHNLAKMIALQKEARSAGRGLWSAFREYDVVATANGSAYHKRGCKHLSNVRHFNEMKASEATDRGLHPCRTCLENA